VEDCIPLGYSEVLVSSVRLSALLDRLTGWMGRQRRDHSAKVAERNTRAALRSGKSEKGRKRAARMMRTAKKDSKPS
jgi:type II secretory pathway pseudopilin PulG